MADALASNFCQDQTEAKTHRRATSRQKALPFANQLLAPDRFAGNDPCHTVAWGFDEPDAVRAWFPQRNEMVKVTLKNYRDSKDYAKIVAVVGRALARQRYVSPVEMLVELKLLATDDLQRWKRGQVPYLERVIRCNLSRAGRILRILRFHAHDLNLKPSITCYHHRKQRLRFSKSGEHLIEEAYSRHFVVVGKRNPFAPPETEAEF